MQLKKPAIFLKKILSGFLVTVMLIISIVPAISEAAVSQSWETVIDEDPSGFAFIDTTADYVLLGIGTKIHKIDRATGSEITNITLSNASKIINGCVDGNYLYVVSRAAAVAPYGLHIAKIDIINMTVATEYTNTTWEYPYGITVINNTLYVSGADNAGACIYDFDLNLNELGDSYIITGANKYFFEIASDGNYLYSSFRLSGTQSGVYKFDLDLTEVANWTVSNDYNLRNIIVEGNNVVACSRDGNPTQKLLYFDAATLTLQHNETIASKYYDINNYNASTFLLSTYEGKIYVKNYSTHAAELEITGFATDEEIFLDAYSSNIYAYGNVNGNWVLRAYSIAEGSTYTYTEQAPPSLSWWDGVYENFTEVGRWAWINTSIPKAPGEYVNTYAPFMMLDKEYTTEYKTGGYVSDSNPLKIYFDWHSPVNVSFIRFYYYDPDGLQYCPAHYTIYIDGNMIYEGNETASVNGQWVVIDFPDQTNVYNLTWVITASKGYIDTGTPTNISIAEVEVFSQDAPLVITQENIPYFEEITRWWNGLNWSFSWRIDDVSTGVSTNWLSIMPTTLCWMSNFASIADYWDTYVNTYHAEIGSHWEQVGQAQALQNYSSAYERATYGINQIETYAGKTSPWGTTCITFGIPFSRSNPHYHLAYWDAGFRAMGYSSNNPDDNYPEYRATCTWLWKCRPPQNMSLYDVVMPHYLSDFIFYTPRTVKPDAWDPNDQKLVAAKENGSWILTISHPGETVSSAFKDWVNNSDCWLATIGEVASYWFYKLYTNVTYSSTGSELIYDINIYNSDDRIWEVPVTFKFNISGLGINDDNINSTVIVKWKNNGTIYRDTWNNIGDLSQKNNRIMQEGYRIQGDYLYLSVKPGTSDRPKSIYFMVGTNSPPQISNPSPPDGETVSSSGNFAVLQVQINDADGDTVTVTFYNASNDNIIGTDTVAGNGTATVTWHNLSYYTTYSWYIVADDGTDTTTSPTWSFYFTKYNSPPSTPSNPSPADGATNVSLNITLSWECNDPDGDPLTYDVYFGTTTDPPLVAENITSPTYDPGPLQEATTYYWKVFVWDGSSGKYSPVWSFTTEGAANQPPVADFTYTIVGKNVTFNASASYDPDGSIINYTWNFGDGSIGYGEIVEHTYAANGTYTVTLTVTDNEGLTSNTSETITLGGGTNGGGGGTIETDFYNYFWIFITILIFLFIMVFLAIVIQK